MTKKTTKPAPKKLTKAEIIAAEKKEHKMGKKVRQMAAPGDKRQFNRMLAMTQPKPEKPAAPE